ncbi:MAG: amidohydrolase family protein, partial [Bryobacteraceae bacterium]
MVGAQFLLLWLSADPIAITGATVVDGAGGAPRIATVVLRDDRIAEVGPGAAIPPGARIIDATGFTILPGLFDLHTHLASSGMTGVAGDWGRTLKTYLYHGVTSVVDFSAQPEQFEPMRRLLREGVVAGPRVTLAARISTPGGHGLEGGRGDFHTLEVLTPREARVGVRRLLASRPDVLKVFTDGWRYGTAPDMTSMDEATLAAIMEEARKEGAGVLT